MIINSFKLGPVIFLTDKQVLSASINESDTLSKILILTPVNTNKYLQALAAPCELCQMLSSSLFRIAMNVGMKHYTVILDMVHNTLLLGDCVNIHSRLRLLALDQ